MSFPTTHRLVTLPAARLVMTALTIALCWACSGPDSGPGAGLEVPGSDLDAYERPVAQALDEAGTQVQANPSSGAAWGRLGEIYDANEIEQPALYCYERAAELDPQEWRWPYLRGLLLRSIDPVGSLDAFTRAGELAPDQAALQFHLGYGHYLAENFDEADRHLTRAVELDPDLLNARLGLARVALARGEPEVALSHLEPVEKEFATQGAIHIHLAQIYRELGRNGEAARQERLTATSGVPANLDGMSRFPDPVRSEVVQREGVSSKRRLEAARRFLGQGRPDQARSEAAAALAADPQSVEAMVLIARLLARENRVDEAEQRLRQALTLDEESPAAWAELGDVHARKRQPSEAIAALTRSLQLDPRQPRLQSNLAGLLIGAGRIDEGIQLLQAAAQALPFDFATHFRLSSSLSLAGRTAEAVAAVQRCLVIDRDNVDALTVHGNGALELGMHRQAEDSFARILRVDATRIDATIGLARALWGREIYADAIGVVRQGLSGHPEDPNLDRWLAWFLATCPREELRDGDQALTLARKLAEAAPADPERLDALAAALAETGKFEAAAENAGRALATAEAVLQEQGASIAPGLRRRMEAFVAALRERVAVYRSGRPYRDLE